MLNNERVKELLEYLNVLSQVQGSGHYVNEEIKEVVKEIRLELGLDKRKVGLLKESRRLVFVAKFGGKVSFVQHMLFEAVFGHYERAEIILKYSQLKEMKKAMEVLKGMKVKKVIRINEEVETVSVIVEQG
ncbi:hypothetical protein QNH48_15040 [Neobacillus sp. YX16]|uniref:hypothetical protein n=1 Tax=Neobacillus sp. YX16 TaxID=3047874 RepID=UPI0024C38D10|nr:hypothetical protein [Neobacillus sp. YX16]WHZ05855.1 hypothetical protein QNH48_15040 [Neobacillus sp. YX16]